MDVIKLMPVTLADEDIDFLFELLKQRKHTISHDGVVKYSDHVSFVKHHPYRYWFKVSDGNKNVGAAYVTDSNTIGVQICGSCATVSTSAVLDILLRDIKPLPPLPSVRQADFVVNVSPSDKSKVEELGRAGWDIVQYTLMKRSK